MEKAYLKCELLDLEIIRRQANSLAGFSFVLLEYLQSMGESKLLQGAVECLKNEAMNHRDNCDALYKKLFDS